MKTPISFRLRKDVDADLAAALGGMDQKRIAELCRNGLRLMLGIRTTKQTAIVERPIITEQTVEIKATSARIGGSGFVKQQGRA